MRRALAVIDGEHYPPVVRAALAELEDEVVAVVFAGGSEKLRGDDAYGVPLERDMEAAIAAFRPEVVLDLSDEPVLDPISRFRLAARVLAAGIPYEGPDFRLEPPVLQPFPRLSLGVVGTGKRVGKTAVTGAIARQTSATRKVVVVAMGRGGPEAPEVIDLRPTLDTLVGLSREGRHAASDHLETALFAGVPTVGCRRCGGGLAGAVATSTVPEGARAALALDPDLVVFDGSGAALPPIETGARVLVAGAHQEHAILTGYLNPYRLLVSDLVVLTMAEPGSGWERIASDLEELVRPGVRVVPVVLRPEPLEPISGERVAYFGTSEAAVAAIARDLEERHGAFPEHVSGALADRARLARELEALRAETFVVELKAAAVDMVVEEALSRQARVVLARSEVVAVDGQDLAGEVERLVELARRNVEVTA